jgi:hypothetical protein
MSKPSYSAGLPELAATILERDCDLVGRLLVLVLSVNCNHLVMTFPIPGHA